MSNFVSEPIRVIEFDTREMVVGEPAQPLQFEWRGQSYSVQSIVDSWKQSGLGHGATTERYLRKHWYKIKTGTGEVMLIYFDREPGTSRRDRWILYSIE